MLNSHQRKSAEKKCKYFYQLAVVEAEVALRRINIARLEKLSGSRMLDFARLQQLEAPINWHLGFARFQKQVKQVDLSVSFLTEWPPQT